MSTFRTAAHGVKWMLAAQLATSVGQFFYAAVTARVFTALEFGGFAAALSLQGILVLLTTTGLPSYVLKRDELSLRVARRIRLAALGGGAISSVAFLLLSGPWLSLLRAPDGEVFVPLLALAQALAPVAAVESALLRREARPQLDAFALFSAFLLSTGTGALLLTVTGVLWTLALAPALHPVALYALSRMLNRARLPADGCGSTSDLWSFSRKISVQNLAFLVLQQAPAWLVSARVGAESLGFFSRAATLTGMPASAISTAVNRTLQPHWRKLNDPESTDRATYETIVLSCALAFPVFGMLIANAVPIISLWLGAGWDQTVVFVPFLAAAYGISIPFTVLANSAEMRGLFKPVRTAQMAMVVGLAPGLIVLLVDGNPIWAAVAMALSQASGFLTLVVLMPWSTREVMIKTLAAVAKQIFWAALACGAGWLVGRFTKTYGITWLGLPAFAQLSLGIMATAVVWLLTAFWNDAIKILSLRGFKIFSGPV